jgi:hypothetical protein
MTVESGPLASVEDLAEFLASGGVSRVLAKSATVRADVGLAIDATVKALDAWKLVLARIKELEELLGEA